ncbi:MAG TPA: hypothetical protein VHM19_07640, partial [Polyangiales bacterium]|nr:hypothetical protein [Polyangiales bacterium]
MTPIPVTRTRLRLGPDPRRVLAKPYLPGEEQILPGASRAALLMRRILAIPEDDVAALLATVMRDFAARHHDFEALLDRHFDIVSHEVPADATLTEERRRLIGAYFTHEYSVESAALFNPSLVLAPDQTGVAPGEQRVVMSLRAVGEGHLSSIEFRTGMLEPSGELRIDSPGPYLVSARRTPHETYGKRNFVAKLRELGVDNEISAAVLSPLPARFSLVELEASLMTLEEDGPPRAILFETFKI